ncbi:hypothetical protein F5B22DRAFT_650567 [Xylaria bambusicola]|uniref:uncharacterized protein n=1 Tax=Xylaria bambusicola TaxID=326684 RepID=UPI0020076F2F|nr:uncharacterized protein F5B22DRAFT_650567 [Xylaria bambusicola]KAI0506604.1 hypothetical protein F5B22DRAFT_650567 [Xylaria bambusicola]
MRPTNNTAGLVRVATPNVDAAPQEPQSSGSKAPSAWFPEECVWAFGESPYLAIRPEIQRYLYDAPIQQYDNTYIGSIVAKNIWRNGTINIDTVDTFMRNLSDVITARIRNAGPHGADDYVLERVFLDMICVQVRWAWLSYPDALRSWKSSNLAILFCSLEEAVRQKAELGWFRDEINEVAKTSFVQREQDGAGKAKFSEG